MAPLAAADPEKGRFRSFLRADCGFFLADQDDRHAQALFTASVHGAPVIGVATAALTESGLTATGTLVPVTVTASIGSSVAATCCASAGETQMLDAANAITDAVRWKL